MELVSVQHDFEYTAKDGRTVSIKPNENYILVSKTNEHWWHVRKDLHTKPFYIPAQYVKQLPTLTQDSPGPNKLDLQECVTNSEPMQKANVTAVIRGTSKAGSNPTHRFSTFGLCEDLPLVKPCEPPREEVQTTRILDHLSKHNTTEEIILSSAPPNTDCLYAKPHNLVKRPKVKNRPKKQSKKPPRDIDVVEQQQTVLQDEDIHFPSPPHSPIYDTIPEIHIPNFDFPKPPAPDFSEETSMFEQQDLSQTEEATFSANDASHTEEVQDPNLRSAVYVNVAQLRKSIGESPPSAPSPFSPPSPDPEGWEVHLDQDSGQEYFYHPVTGQTTWDNPYLYSPTDQDPDPFPVEDHRTPSPAQSPALSPSTASPTAWTSDWEQLVDEPSGRLYFYNAMSGETSWEPPEPLSPYPPLMTEPMSVHRFHEDGPPPLPEEDYPAEDYPSEDYPTVDFPEAYEELPHATSPPPTLPKEFTLSHVSRTIIPRANLDRSTPSGWNLNVEPSGTWVFTRENSTEQWVKSVDERGQTYYYLRDGSRSQWNLPEAPVAHGMSRLENGIDAENVSIIKNWRHSIGPGQLASAQDDGRFYPTHRRKTSDYSSDSSSTGNSPETQHNAFGFRPWRNPYYRTSRWLRYNVQNLEKAGILNKTKVCENGKKVRKNWSQTWTVLLGGVLTFHKDPKSAATGASNKTNQIVPEITVDLRGATIGRASKDKSSKKNVLELKGKNGVEFLVQYDTESIINDWHKVLVDTIRQLEYQDHHSEEEDNDLYDKIAITEPERVVSMDKKRPSTKPTVTPSSSNAGENDQKRVRTKLMKFLMKRPTLQSVKEKGYIRDNVFGCHLATLCAQERTTIPSFVEKCIIALEKRGLDIDGLYRVSGNLATIQRLRFKADHEELDFEDGQWEDAHVLTGALKLFFRELPEPLFPFSHFHKFIAAIRISDYHSKLSCMEELVRTLPPSNHDTMKLLFGHLRRLIQFGEDNRMTVQNVAIVFGPTLLRPEMESNNIAMHMIFQNQIVEFVLNEYEHLFLSS